MPPRAYVLIFFFWLLLTIITPALVFWSASEKTNPASQGETTMRINSRRVIASMENAQLKNRSITIAMSPSPAPAPDSNERK